MDTELKEIAGLLRARDTVSALSRCRAYIGHSPSSLDAYILLARACQQGADIGGMLAAARSAVENAPDNQNARLLVVEALIYSGEISEAKRALGELQGSAPWDIAFQQKIAEFYVQLGDHEAANAVHREALKAAPKNAGLLYNLATSELALGHLEEAEKLFTDVIALNGSDYDAYYNRSVLRRQTRQQNHIESMERLLKAGTPDRKGAVQLFFALAKEYEDLGDYAEAFAHLKRGADLRAAMLAYDIRSDIQAMDLIKATFDKAFAEKCPPASAEPGPIFIVGLPRTGTTLVDRILSSHSDVESLGEINDLPMAITRLAGQANSKEALIKASAELDFDALGQAYLKSSYGRGTSKAFVVDKTPLNFLYIGLITRAMPTARIIHMTRGAMDSCFAIYKTLFRTAYPFSYRLDDLADYFKAYSDLMLHWHTVLPGRVLDVSYEALVTEPEAQVRRLLDHSGLGWQDDCLAFHKNATPSATASAAQVRQPLYTSSIGRWQSYAAELEPLRARLKQHGIAVDAEAAA